MAEQAKKQEVAVRAEERAVKYLAADGQEVTLTIDTVKRYLVQGDSSLVTIQELMYFLNICRARRLNPLTKDCYLIKYSADPAAIVTSIDFFRKRAKVQKDCPGWQKGVIVRTKEGRLRDSFGLVDEGETLIGGWFEAQPTGWIKPFRLEVNLSGYIKKTREGKVTRFWEEANQPTMIAKVAEAQGLRTLWPDEFQAIFTAEEGAVPVLEIPEPIDIKTMGRFAEMVEEQKFSKEDQKLFEEYCEFQAKKNRWDMETLQKKAEEDFNGFVKYFNAYKEKAIQKTSDKPPEETKKNEPPANDTLFDQSKKMRGEGEKPTK